MDDVSEFLLRSWMLPWAVEKEREAVLRSGEREHMLEELGRAPLPTEYGDFTYLVYGDMRTGQHHNVLVKGKLNNGAIGDGENILCRTHSACWTNEVARAVNCECREEFHQTMLAIQAEDRGIMIYLDQEGRGTGIAGKMAQLNGMFGWDENEKIIQKTDDDGKRVDTDKAYKDAGFPSECRDFSIAGEILHKLGVKSVRLVTNNPAKIAGVEAMGVRVIPTEIHVEVPNEIVANDLQSKAENLGHTITKEQYVFTAKA